MNLIFVKGFWLGLSIAATVGPISLLCIRKTLVYGRLSGFMSGMGAATADTLYGLIAALGFTVIMDFFVTQKTYFSLFGGIFLCYLGLKAFFIKPQPDVKIENRSLSLIGDYFTTFLLTLVNPMTILLFIALFANVGISSVSYKSALFFTTGVFVGTSLWWLFLSLVVGFFREKVTLQWMSIINKISGAAIAGFGIYSILSVLRYWRF